MITLEFLFAQIMTIICISNTHLDILSVRFLIYSFSNLKVSTLINLDSNKEVISPFSFDLKEFCVYLLRLYIR